MKNIFEKSVLFTLFMCLLFVFSNCDSKKKGNIFDPAASGKGFINTQNQPVKTVTVDQNTASANNQADEDAGIETEESDEEEIQEEDSSNEVTGYEGEESDCDQHYYQTYNICRSPVSNSYFLPTYRGDFWGVGSTTPTFVYINTYHPEMTMWRSSYAQSPYAPTTCVHGHPLNSMSPCPLCNHGGSNYRNLGLAARNLDDGLYYMERYNATGNAQYYARAYASFNSPYIRRVCGSRGVIRDLMGAVQNKVSSVVSDFVYNLIDKINGDRYGYSNYDKLDVCR